MRKPLLTDAEVSSAGSNAATKTLEELFDFGIAIVDTHASTLSGTSHRLQSVHTQAFAPSSTLLHGDVPNLEKTR